MPGGNRRRRTGRQRIENLDEFGAPGRLAGTACSHRPGGAQAQGNQLGHLRHADARHRATPDRSEEHTSELQSLMRISYAVFCLKKKKNTDSKVNTNTIHNLLTEYI